MDRTHCSDLTITEPSCLGPGGLLSGDEIAPRECLDMVYPAPLEADPWPVTEGWIDLRGVSLAREQWPEVFPVVEDSSTTLSTFQPATHRTTRSYAELVRQDMRSRRRLDWRNYTLRE